MQRSDERPRMKREKKNGLEKMFQELLAENSAKPMRGKKKKGGFKIANKPKLEETVENGLLITSNESQKTKNLFSV
jgi:hypothetical protein